MYGKLPLARTPFGPGFDGSLHLESPRRAISVRKAKKLLAQGNDLWVAGPTGAGRESFLANLAEASGNAAAPVIHIGRESRIHAGSLLEAVHQALFPHSPPSDSLEVAEEIYSSLIKTLSRGTALIVISDTSPWTAEDKRELTILSELLVLGTRIALIAGCGEGEPPLPTMETLAFTPPEPEEITEILRSRMALVGGVGLLSDELGEVAQRAHGFGQALTLAQNALWRAAFKEEPAEIGSSDAPDKEPLFKEETLSELGRLLADISDGPDEF